MREMRIEPPSWPALLLGGALLLALVATNEMKAREVERLERELSEARAMVTCLAWHCGDPMEEEVEECREVEGEEG